MFSLISLPFDFHYIDCPLSFSGFKSKRFLRVHISPALSFCLRHQPLQNTIFCHQNSFILHHGELCLWQRWGFWICPCLSPTWLCMRTKLDENGRIVLLQILHFCTRAGPSTWIWTASWILPALRPTSSFAIYEKYISTVKQIIWKVNILMTLAK